MKSYLDFILLLTFFLGVTALTSYAEQGITGFLIAGEGHVQEIGLETEGDGTYNWIPDVYEENSSLAYLMATGSVSGNGTGYARAYLVSDGRRYLILSHTIDAPENGFGITGYDILGDGNETTTTLLETTTTLVTTTTSTTLEPTTTIPTTTTLETTTTTAPTTTTLETTTTLATTTTLETTTTIPTTTLPNTTTTTIPPNGTTTSTTPETTTTLPTTLPTNETTSTTLEPTTTTTILETTTTTIPPNGTTTTILFNETTTTFETTTTLITTTTFPQNATEPIMEFMEECIDTCNLTIENLTSPSYSLELEVSDGLKLSISELIYAFQSSEVEDKFANLAIWDDTDSVEKYPGQHISFFANYSHAGGPIRDATCMVYFNTDKWNGPFSMEFRDEVYVYETFFGYNGTYEWKVFCSREYYTNLTTFDDFTISLSEILIADKKDERIEVLPGQTFCIERTVEGPTGTRLTFVPLFSEGPSLEKIQVKTKTETGRTPLTGVTEVKPRVFRAGEGASDRERQIDEMISKLPPEFRDLSEVSYSEEFELASNRTVSMCFRAPPLGETPRSGRISYLIYSGDEYDYEGTTWWNSSWYSCKNITITNVGSTTLTDFPAYINVSYQSGKMQSDYDDIRFVNTSCNNDGEELDYEIDNYTASNAHVWVRIPSLAVPNKIISMYYNNPQASGGENETGVWDRVYGGVWHLNEINAVDSTGNGNTGTQTGSPVINSSCPVGRCVGFIPTDEINLGTGSTIDLSNQDNATVELWVYQDDTAVDRFYFMQSQSTDSWNFGGGTYSGDVSGNAFKFLHRDDDGTNRDTITTGVHPGSGAWHYVTMVYQNGATDFKGLYLNGKLNSSTSTGINNLRAGPATSTVIGYGGDLGPWDGNIDEVRISKQVLSADWINQTYQMTANQGTYVTWGTEEKNNNITNCLNITDSGTYYLTQNITNSGTSYCMNISANDVILDCQGNRIDGNDLADYGIFVNRSSSQTTNVTIRNCTVSNWDGANIYFYNANENTIEYSVTNSSPDDGLRFGYSDSNTIRYTDSVSNSYGIYSLFSSYNTFANSTFSENTILDFYVSSNTLINCHHSLDNVTGSGNRPIEYYNYSANIQDKELSELILCQAQYCNVTNVTIDGSSSINNNGIFMLNVENSTFTNVSSSNNYYGFYVIWSSLNNFTNISSSGNEYGFQFRRVASNNTINNSIIRDNAQAGIWLDESGSDDPGNNTIYNCLLNNTVNLLIDTDIASPNFLNTTNQTGTRIYGAGNFIGGNYWTNSTGNGFSDTCTDAGGDGFCDSIYNLTNVGSVAVDYLPLSSGCNITSPVTLTSNLNCGDNLTITSAGSLNTAGYAVTVGKYINVYGNLTPESSSITATNGTIVYNGGFFKGGSGSHVMGTIMINTGGIYNLTSGVTTLNGDMNNSGTFYGNNGTVILAENGTFNLGGTSPTSKSFYNLTINEGKKLTMVGALNVIGSYNINGIIYSTSNIYYTGDQADWLYFGPNGKLEGTHALSPEVEGNFNLPEINESRGLYRFQIDYGGGGFGGSRLITMQGNLHINLRMTIALSTADPYNRSLDTNGYNLTGISDNVSVGNVQNGTLYLRGGNHYFNGLRIYQYGKVYLMEGATLSNFTLFFNDGSLDVLNGTIINITANGTSFNLKNTYNVSVNDILTQPNTSGCFNVSKYVNITNTTTSATTDLNISYSDEDLGGNNESDLRIYRHNGNRWVYVPSNVDTDNNVVYATGISEFSIFAPLGGVYPKIDWIPPTPDDGNVTIENFVYLNATVEDLDNTSAFIDWNRSLVGYWSFEHVLANGTVYDNSTYGNDGTMVNFTSNTTVSSDFGSGVYFDGENDYINCGNSDDFDLTENFTIEAWIKPGHQLYYNRIVDKNRMTAYAFRVRDNNTYGRIELAVAKEGVMYGNDNWSTTNDFIVGQWSHVAATYNGSLIQYYINGLNAGTATPGPPGPVDTNDEILSIGGSGSVLDYFFNGTIDEVRIHKRILSNEEINASYNSGSYRLESNLTSLSDGTYDYTAWAIDIGGNTNVSTRSVTVDSSTPPIINWEDPTPYNGEVVSEDYVYLNATLIDDSKTSALFDWNRSLVGYWSFEYTNATGVFDNSSYQNFGAFVGGLEESNLTAGKYGQGLEFDGSDDYVNVSSYDDFKTVEMTVAAWVYPREMASDDGYIKHIITRAENSSSGYEKHFILYFNNWSLPNNRVQITFWNQTGSQSCSISLSTVYIQKNEWSFVAGGFNGTHCFIFLNGEKMDSANTSTMNYQAEKQLMMGRRPGSGASDSGYFNGTIDEVRFWNRALSDEELFASYLTGLEKHENLKGYWSFEYANSTHVLDNSTNHNHATFNGTAFSDSNLTTGNYGQGLEFDGSDDFLEVDSSLYDLTGDKSIEAWVYTNSYNPDGSYDRRIVVKTIDSNNGFQLSLVQPKYGFGFAVNDGGTQYLDFNNGTSIGLIDIGYSLNSWYHLVGTYDDSSKEILLYVNGINDSCEEFSRGFPSETSLKIGTYNSTIGHFNGTIDEVRIWNKVLTQEEINLLYQNGLYRLQKNFTSLSDGNYDYTAWAIDEAGNMNASTRSVNVGITNCKNITSPGTYYLTQNITDSATDYCMNISANNVTLDCQGHEIDGNDTTLYGIYINRSSYETTNITIRNCTVSDWDGANVYLRFANGNNLTEINSLSSPICGLYMLYSGYNNVTSSNLLENSENDLYVATSEDWHCNNLFSNVNGSGGRPIEYYNYSVNLENKELSALFLCNADNSNVTNVTIEGSLNIKNNRFFIIRTENSKISDVNSSDNSNGLWLYYSNSNNITNITTNHNIYGIRLEQSSSNNITNITSNSNSYGLRFYLDSDSNIINNSFIQNSSSAGIWLDESTTYDPENNTIYNCLLNNTLNLKIDDGIASQNYLNTTNQTGSRIYGSGTNIGGNYWTNSTGNGFSDTCTDAGGDGFCDDAYDLTNGTSVAVDWLPLSDEYIGCGYYVNSDLNLEKDITGCTGTIFYINASDVTLDCQNHYLQSAGDYGINNTGFDNVTIMNCEINMSDSGSDYGIYYHTTNNGTLYNNTVNVGQIFGLGFEHTNYTNITENKVNVFENSNGMWGISLVNSCYFNNITNNYVRADQYSIYIANSNYNTQIIGNNITADNNNGVFISSTDSNFINNNLTSYYNSFVLDVCQNCIILDGSIRSTEGNDYYIKTNVFNSGFRNTNFTASRLIKFDSSTSWFNYNNASTGGIWLNTSVSAQATLTRELTNWNTSLVQWNDTNTSGTGITATYNVSNLTANAYYNIYNNSVLAQSLQADSNGVLPQFTILLDGERELKVEYSDEGPKYWDNSTNSTYAGEYVEFRLRWTDTKGLSHYILGLDNCIGYFANVTWAEMTGTGNWSNETRLVNSTVGCTVRWKFYANDTDNNWNVSEEYSFITTYNPYLTGCTNITEPGTYYLTQNITDSSTDYCMNISANNVTLDCQGFTIDGNNAAVYGIYTNRSSSETTNITIRNCTVTEWSSANIYFRNANGNKFEYMASNSSPDYAGIWLYYSDSNNITNVTSNYNVRGIQIHESDYNNLTNVTANYNSYAGIFHESSENSMITNSTLSENSIWDLHLTAYEDQDCNNQIENITGSGGNQIKYYNSSTVISDEVLSELVLCNADNSNITNITIDASPILKNSDIRVLRTSNTNFTNINSSNNYNGLSFLYSSNYNKVTNLTVNSNYDNGIRLFNSSFNNFTNINSYYNQYGIKLYCDSDNNIIDGSVIYNNTMSGLWIYNDTYFSSGHPEYNKIYSNVFNNSGIYGNLRLSSEVIATNYLNTTNQTGTRIYGAGNFIGGNYWTNSTGNGFSDTCTDAGGDGFCDDIYNLTNGTSVAVDWLPLSDEYIGCGYYVNENLNLDHDITGCTGTILYINASDVTLDCQNHYLQSTGSYGINSTVFSNVTIKNCIVNMSDSGSDYGIYFYYTNNSKIENNTVNVINDKAVGLDFSNYNNITNNTIEAGSSTGLSIFYYSENNIIDNNNLKSNMYGIYFGIGSNNNTIYNNTIIAINRAIIFWESYQNNIIEGSIKANTNDYYLRSSGLNNSFRSTNFTAARQIYFYDTASWFNYNNQSSDGIWLNTSVSAQATLTRELTNWNQTLVQWNDTNTSGTGITATYNVSNLTANAYYNIYNNSVLAQSLQADSNGVLPQFTILLDGEREVKVEQDQCYITSPVTLTSNLNCADNLTITSSGYLTTNNYNITVGEDFNLQGNITMGSSTMTISGNFNATDSSVFLRGTSKVIMNGTGNLRPKYSWTEGSFYRLYVAYPSQATTLSNNIYAYELYLNNGTYNTGNYETYLYGYSLSPYYYLFGNATITAGTGYIRLRIGGATNIWNNTVNVPRLSIEPINCPRDVYVNMSSDMNVGEILDLQNAPLTCKFTLITDGYDINTVDLNIGNNEKIIAANYEIINVTDDLTVKTNSTLNATRATINVGDVAAVQQTGTFVGDYCNITVGNYFDNNGTVNLTYETILNFTGTGGFGSSNGTLNLIGNSTHRVNLTGVNNWDLTTNMDIYARYTNFYNYDTLRGDSETINLDMSDLNIGSANQGLYTYMVALDNFHNATIYDSNTGIRHGGYGADDGFVFDNITVESTTTPMMLDYSDNRRFEFINSSFNIENTGFSGSSNHAENYGIISKNHNNVENDYSVLLRGNSTLSKSDILTDFGSGDNLTIYRTDYSGSYDGPSKFIIDENAQLNTWLIPGYGASSNEDYYVLEFSPGVTVTFDDDPVAGFLRNDSDYGDTRFTFNCSGQPGNWITFTSAGGKYPTNHWEGLDTQWSYIEILNYTLVQGHQSWGGQALNPSYIDNCIFEGGSSSSGAFFIRDSNVIVSTNVTVRDSLYGFRFYGSSTFIDWNITNITGTNWHIQRNYGGTDVHDATEFVNSTFDEDKVIFNVGHNSRKGIISKNHNRVEGRYLIWTLINDTGQMSSSDVGEDRLFKSDIENYDFGPSDNVTIKQGNFTIDEAWDYNSINVTSNSKLIYNYTGTDLLKNYYKASGGRIYINFSTLTSNDCKLNNSNILDNTTGSNYWIDSVYNGGKWEVSSMPYITWEDPTPDDGNVTSNDWVYLNATVTDASNTSAFIDWNHSLVGYWSFEYTNATQVFDNSSYNNFCEFRNVTYENITSGKYGRALYFDGDDKYLLCGNDSSLNLTNEVTMEAWIKPNSLHYGFIISRFIGGSPGAGYVLDTRTAGGIALEIRTADEDRYRISSDGSYSPGIWQHVVGVYDGRYSKIYINSTEIVNYDWGSEKDINQDQVLNLLIGGNYADFNGTIDEVRIYNRALGPEEINASYNNGLYRLEHNFTSLNYGTYDYTAWAIDLAGNTNTSSRNVTIDLPPKYWDNSTNSTYAGEPVEFRLRWTDYHGLSGYVFSLCNGTWNGTNCNEFEGLCYQETANESSVSDGDCDLNYTGGYYCSGNWSFSFPCSNVYDEDWNTYGEAYSGFPFNYSYLYVNYTKPENALNSSKWRVKFTNNVTGPPWSVENNLSIPNSCWNYRADALEFKITSQSTTTGIISYWDCRNNTDWVNLGTTLTDVHSYEEAMWWNINLSGWVNDTWSDMTGTGNWSNVTKVVNSTVGAEIAWKVYANDTFNNWNVSETYSFVTTGRLTDCTNITVPGNYYLTQNITDSATDYCMNISANNVTLDCLGNQVDGNDNVDYGIYVYRSPSQTTNITIRNCTVSDWNESNIYFRNSHGNSLFQTISSSSPNHGIHFYDSDYNNLTNVTTNNNSDNGIYLYYSDGLNLTNITSANNTGYGIHISISNLTEITDSLLSENDYSDFFVSSSTDLNCNNYLENVTGSGGRQIKYYNYSVSIQNEILSELVLCNADISNITNVTINGSDSVGNNMLYVSRTENANITNVNSSQNRLGIYLWRCNSTYVTNVTANSNIAGGFNLEYSNHTHITGITSNSNYQGIRLYYSLLNNLSNMTSNSNTYGISITNCSYNNITNATLSSNWQGLSSSFSNSTILNNSVITASSVGVYLSSSGPENSFYNNLLNNTFNVNFTGTNYSNEWNITNQTGSRIYGSGANIGGNYWTNSTGNGFSDTCVDVNRDGYCDQVYDVYNRTWCEPGVNCSDNVDYLPLSNKYESVDCGYYVNENLNLDQDITGCTGTIFYINASNVLLDCQNHYLQSTGDYGINNTNFNNVTVRNCIVNMSGAGSDSGIYIANSDNGTFYNNTIAVETDNAIYLSSSDGNNLTDNIFKANGAYSIRLQSSYNNSFSGGSIIASNLDYSIESSGSGNFFRNTNFTASRKINFPDVLSWFNYNNQSSDGIWVNTSSLTTGRTITRQLYSWNQTYVKWKDTPSTGMNANYTLSGLETETYYLIYNNSAKVYTLKTDAIGNLPYFSILLSAERNITVQKDQTKPYIEWVPPTPSDGNATNKNWVYLNATVTDDLNTSAFIDWNRSLVGYWSFEYTNATGVFDNSSYQNFANFTGADFGEDNLTAGKYGQGLEFDGSDDYINTEDIDEIEHSDATFSFWIIANNLNTDLDIITKGPHSTNQPLVIWRDETVGPADVGSGNTDTVSILTYDGSVQHWVAAPNGTLNDSNWHYFAFIIDNQNNEIEIYKDGVSVASNTKSWNGIYANTNNLRIGDANPSNLPFDGTIDEVRIYNRALSPEEINASYNNGLYRLEHNFTSLSDGLYDYTAWAIDENGNMNSSSRNVTVDTTLPIITIESPANETYPNNTIWFNVTLNEPGSWCGYSLNGEPNATMSNDTTTHFYKLNDTLLDGSYHVLFYCNDSVGNMNWTEEWFSVSAMGMNITKIFLPQIIVAREAETVNVTTNVMINKTSYDVVDINVSDEVPYDFEEPQVADVKVYFINYTSLQTTDITGSVSIGVTDPGGGRNKIVSVNITNESMGGYIKENDTVRINYLMNSSQMEPGENRTVWTNVTGVDVNLNEKSFQENFTITAAEVTLRGWKDFFIPNLSNPQLITFRIFMEARGGPVGDIYLADYIPPGGVLHTPLNVTYQNTTGSYILTNATDYLAENYSVDILPDGSEVSIYLYNFTYAATENWSTYLGDRENITIEYNVTVLGGGRWLLPAIISGFDPTYQKHIRTEMYADTSVPSFDVSLSVTTKKIKPGEPVKALLKLTNVGGPRAKVDVFNTYSVKTMSGELINEKSETFAVVAEEIREISIETPGSLKPGMYTFESFVTYTGREAMTTDTFEVEGGEELPVVWILAAIGALAAVILLAVWRTRR